MPPRLDLENPPEVSSVRYNSHKGELVLTPVHYLLWDLAQVFSTIRFKNKELCRTYELAYYSQEANQGVLCLRRNGNPRGVTIGTDYHKQITFRRRCD